MILEQMVGELPRRVRDHEVGHAVEDAGALW